MKRSPKDQLLIKPSSLLEPKKPVDEMRFSDMFNGALVVGSFLAFSLLAWYGILKWLHIF